MVSVTLAGGRSIEVKQSFYAEPPFHETLVARTRAFLTRPVLGVCRILVTRRSRPRSGGVPSDEPSGHHLLLDD
jgi:hypothetical protein